MYESDYISPLSYISTFEIKKHETLTADNGLQLGFDAKVETDGAFFLPKEMTVLISLPRMKWRMKEKNLYKVCMSNEGCERDDATVAWW